MRGFPVGDQMPQGGCYVAVTFVPYRNLSRHLRMPHWIYRYASDIIKRATPRYFDS
jgi:hypothetical protein